MQKVGRRVLVSQRLKQIRRAARKHISHADLLLEEEKITFVSNKMEGKHKTLGKRKLSHLIFHMNARDGSCFFCRALSSRFHLLFDS